VIFYCYYKSAPANQAQIQTAQQALRQTLLSGCSRLGWQVKSITFSLRLETEAKPAFTWLEVVVFKQTKPLPEQMQAFETFRQASALSANLTPLVNDVHTEWFLPCA
jgi:hypothetical protein